ncbi:MAG: hypothetical protein V4723_07510 [Pseudomonadota bacterium]
MDEYANAGCPVRPIWSKKVVTSSRTVARRLPTAFAEHDGVVQAIIEGDGELAARRPHRCVSVH